MNDDCPITVAPGVTRINCSWGYYLEGKKEQIIAAGLAKPSWFTDPKERNKRGQIVRSKTQLIDGRRIDTTLPASGRCFVRFHYTDSERVKIERAKNCKYEPKTAQEFRRDSENAAKSFLFSLHRLTGWHAENAPYRYDDEALESLRENIAEILLTIRDGRIVKLRDAINFERLEATLQAESDPQFQRFMGKLQIGQGQAVAQPRTGPRHA
ncbi:MAG: hypothetical protein HYY78_12145 [Betaproteobacteria bacterium]|nr:hypothetical protein [Betaproteobacteria bacterium]